MYVFVITYASLSETYIGSHMCVTNSFKMFLATLVRTMANLLCNDTI